MNPQERKVVLAVDDAPENIQVVNSILKETDKIRIATNGAKALELANAAPQPDLILLDVKANGFPGANAVIPPENGTIAEMLVDSGYSTFCVGKWHLTPETEQHMAASRRTWPTGRGFERYYGFLGGETNQWYPDVVEDNHFGHAPYGPEEGYHLSKDLVDKSLFLRGSHAPILHGRATHASNSESDAHP